jgi:hypothetical protein
MVGRSAFAVFALVMLCHGTAFGKSGPWHATQDSCRELGKTPCYTSGSNPKYRWCYHPFTYSGVTYEIQWDTYTSTTGDINADPIWYFDCQNTLDKTWIDAAGTCKSYCKAFHVKGKIKGKKKTNF